jgi:hypothetical protein
MLDSLNDNRGTGSAVYCLELGVLKIFRLDAFGVNWLILRCLASTLLDLSNCSVLRLITLFVRFFSSGDSAVASKSSSSILMGFGLCI